MCAAHASFLSTGFCQFVIESSVSARESEALPLQWASPRLQVLDIQRFPPIPREKEPSRFYLAASDAVSLIWVVVPPQTALESDIAQFNVDVGCFLTLQKYTLVPATNGRSVVIAIQATFTPHASPLVGAPIPHPEVPMTFSPGALQPHTEPTDPAASHPIPAELEAMAQALEGYTTVTLKDIVHHPGCVLHAWKIDLQWVWVGTPFSSSSSGGGGGGPPEAADMSGKDRRRARHTLKTVAMDGNGHLIGCIFYGRWGWLEEQIGSRLSSSASSSVVGEKWGGGGGEEGGPPLRPLRLRCGNGGVVWESTTTAAVPSQLSFREDTTLLFPLSCPASLASTVVSPSSTTFSGEGGGGGVDSHGSGTSRPLGLPSSSSSSSSSFPLFPVGVVGELAGTLPSVSFILQEVPVGQVVSFTATVVSVRSGVLTHTKRGSTLRAHLLVADPVQRLTLLEVTTWGDAAKDTTRFERGKRYWFHNLAVREFQQKKNVSSRSDSLFVFLADVFVPEKSVEASSDAIPPPHT